ncbi:MAG: hypothetical protein K1W00_08490 [Lachnospiraceae bacterium]
MDNNYVNTNYENTFSAAQPNPYVNGQAAQTIYQEPQQQPAPPPVPIETPVYQNISPQYPTPVTPDAVYQNNVQYPVYQESEIEGNSISSVEKENNSISSRRPMFALWSVGGYTYRLKLKTQAINELERKYKTNLLSLLGSEAGLPALNVMLDIAHAAMAPWHNGIRRGAVEAIFDLYVDEGGSQLQFFKDVYLEIFKASGFFSKEMLENMKEI